MKPIEVEPITTPRPKREEQKPRPNKDDPWTVPSPYDPKENPQPTPKGKA
jgi:hypothetical protein